mmetsp:Transcript_61588/g.144247  ORF Transcript_61588/g.144247 Transcript_61588/m.144247 type:complete len:217 (-) Transcript_61588:621-1271(-)
MIVASEHWLCRDCRTTRMHGPAKGLMENRRVPRYAGVILGWGSGPCSLFQVLVDGLVLAQSTALFLDWVDQAVLRGGKLEEVLVSNRSTVSWKLEVVEDLISTLFELFWTVALHHEARPQHFNQLLPIDETAAILVEHHEGKLQLFRLRRRSVPRKDDDELLQLNHATAVHIEDSEHLPRNVGVFHVHGLDELLVVDGSTFVDIDIPEALVDLFDL